MIAAKTNYGKTKVEVVVRGCTDCGTENSHAWGEVKIVNVQIESRQFAVSIPICGHCAGIPCPPAQLAGKAGGKR